MAARNNERCRMLPNYEVEHLDCEDYADGVITKISNGRDNGRIVAHIVDGKRVDIRR